ncbi:MAG TPA: hypothetical protein VJS92_12655 [Candidatus Polarisedimenticolaceae bacterium]|nr:hypothetical protein [Candidatus Polarisedimenticolaceae bacterium]
MENKIVVHMKDGTIHKGVTQDFETAQPSFHLLPGEGGGVPIRVRLEEMKALFYVKDYIGNRDYVARRQFDEAKRASRRAIVVFHDGEEIWGTLGPGADEPGSGFYFFPADQNDNNIRIFVIRSALKELRRMD